MPGTIVQPSGHGGADDDADCKCGDEIFAKENQKWCRHKFCTGEGEEVEDKGTWSGEMEGGKRTGAECSGRALNLKKTCNRKCNFYKEDEDRNFDGLLRGYVPCNASHVKKRIFCPKTTQFGPKLAFLSIAGSFGALLVGWLVVVARGLYPARHLFSL